MTNNSNYCSEFCQWTSVLMTFSDWHCWFGSRKSIRFVKKWRGAAWFSDCSKVQMSCIWSSWCHCHSTISASEKPEWFILLGCPGKKTIKRLCSVLLRSTINVSLLKSSVIYWSGHQVKYSHLYCIICCNSLNDVEAGINLHMSIRCYQNPVYWIIFLQSKTACSFFTYTTTGLPQQHALFCGSYDKPIWVTDNVNHPLSVLAV